MPGKVTVFNCSSESAQLQVSSGQAGAIAALSQGAGASYTPGSITVGRSGSPSPGAFAQGSNPVVILWDSMTGSTTVDVPAGIVSLDDDLLLFVTSNQAFLVTTRGYTVGTFAVQRSMP
jgi:hypothetical protein